MEREDIEKVINKGYCVGCGICASVKGSPYKVKMNTNGFYKAELTENSRDNNIPNSVCPFSSEAKDENEISEQIFNNIPNLKKNDLLGYYSETFAGHVSEGDFRKKGSSGGGVSWLLKELMEKGLIDAVIHVKESNNQKVIFEYGISNSINEIKMASKSRYYPVELSKAISALREMPKGKKVAVVGIPCFIKGLRNLALVDDEINKKLKFFIGILCGHLKSKNFASLFAWQHGITPSRLTNIDFRYKYRSNDAALYSVKLTYLDKFNNEKEIITPPSSELFGTDWGLGFFKYKSCDYCDDIFAETADIVFGDAWIPGFREDWRGDNILIIRRSDILDLFMKGINEGKLNLKKIDQKLVKKSQSGSIRHRTIGLSYRLAIKERQNEWTPKKRIKPTYEGVDSHYITTQNYRMWFTDNVPLIFKKAIKKNNFLYFKRKLYFKTLRYGYHIYGIKALIPLEIKAFYRKYFKDIAN